MKIIINEFLSWLLDRKLYLAECYLCNHAPLALRDSLIWQSEAHCQQWCSEGLPVPDRSAFVTAAQQGLRNVNPGIWPNVNFSDKYFPAWFLPSWDYHLQSVVKNWILTVFLVVEDKLKNFSICLWNSLFCSFQKLNVKAELSYFFLSFSILSVVSWNIPLLPCKELDILKTRSWLASCELPGSKSVPSSRLLLALRPTKNTENHNTMKHSPSASFFLPLGKKNKDFTLHPTEFPCIQYIYVDKWGLLLIFIPWNAGNPYHTKPTKRMWSSIFGLERLPECHQPPPARALHHVGRLLNTSCPIRTDLPHFNCYHIYRTWSSCSFS